MRTKNVNNCEKNKKREKEKILIIKNYWKSATFANIDVFCHTSLNDVFFEFLSGFCDPFRILRTLNLLKIFNEKYSMISRKFKIRRIMIRGILMN